MLICAICLPLSRCSQSKTAQHQQISESISQRLFPQTDEQFHYTYAVAKIDSSWCGMLTVLAFAWPCLFLPAERKLRGARFGWIQYLLELILCGGTIYWLYGLTLLEEWLYGAYIVLAAIVFLASTALISLFHDTRAFLIRRRVANAKALG